MEIEENIPLAPFTTFHIGGSAQYFVRINTIDALREAFAFAKERALKVLILGGGSNILVSDAGFDGLVIKIEITGALWREEGDKTLLIAGAGESWDGLVKQAVEKNLWGVENLSGIPGTVGGAPIQNIGAYGAELRDTLAWVEALDTHSGEVKTFSNNECEFSYRASRFKKEAGRFVVLRAGLSLEHVPKPNISYRDLAAAFAQNPEPQLAEIRAAVLAIRAGKFPDLAKEGTAGSFFLNPVVGDDIAARLLEQYPELPRYPAVGGVKLSLAWLLDKVLGLRGLTVGGARLFEKQPLVIVAKKNCAARDVAALAEMVQKKVKEKIGIEIETEVRII